MLRYQFIRSNECDYPLSILCEVLQVSRSGYYKWLRRHKQVTEREIRNKILEEKVKGLFHYHKKRYGAIRVREELLKEGVNVGVKKVSRIMKDHNLVSVHSKKFKVVTTNSKHALGVSENKLNREFSVSAPNQIWVSDITYIQVTEGWLYLAVIIDLFSRRVVGYHTSSRINAALILEAFDKALKKHKPSEGLLFHSDRGIQFACGDFRAVISKAKFTQSMSRKGNCWDNAPAESFFATLKKELIHELGICTSFQVERELFEYIEAYYNTIRIHSSLDYLSPLEFEKLRMAA